MGEGLAAKYRNAGGIYGVNWALILKAALAGIVATLACLLALLLWAELKDGPIYSPGMLGNGNRILPCGKYRARDGWCATSLVNWRGQ